jgi:hypothetical protein
MPSLSLSHPALLQSYDRRFQELIMCLYGSQGIKTEEKEYLTVESLKCN